VMVCT